MATAQSNPCGLSTTKVVDAIRSSVMVKAPDAKNDQTGRGEVLKALMGDGFTYAEAKEISDYYFKIYKRVAPQVAKKNPVTPLTTAQRNERRTNNVVVSFLRGDTGSSMMQDADIKHLESIYNKADLADTPTLKQKYYEEADAFVSKFLPYFENELFKGFVYAKPLTSTVFFIKSVMSNLYGQFERYLQSVWDGKKFDFTTLWKVSDLANSQALNVTTGGVPATSLYQTEGTLSVSARLEEYDLKGSPVDGSKYFGLIKFWNKISNRMNATPDTYAIFSNAERHYYQLLKEKYRALGLTKDQVTQNVLKDMELDDIDAARRAQVIKFKALGLPTHNSKGMETNQFRVAVAEFRRLKREDGLWQRSVNLAKNDFWKKNMMDKTELGFGDTGIFGIKAQLLSRARDWVEGKQKGRGKTTSAFNLFAFGFLNGAANFAEDSLERFPLYGALKWALLQRRGKQVSDAEILSDIKRRQKDLAVKSLTTFMFFAMAKLVESVVCPEDDSVPSAQISAGRTQIGVCGIPAIVPPQMMPMFKVYQIILNTMTTPEDAADALVNIFPVLVQSNSIGLGGTLDKITAGATDYISSSTRGDEIRKAESLIKTQKSVIDAGIGVANSFLPFPTRPLQEVGMYLNRAVGAGQKQQSLPFATDEMGKPLGYFNTTGQIVVQSLGNVTGVSEIAMAAANTGKNYSMDWQGRKVYTFRGSDVFGTGIQYNQFDDILMGAGVPAPYVARTTKVEYDESQNQSDSYMGAAVNEKEAKIRYMTDEEYFNVHKALGDFNREHFEQYEDAMVRRIKEDRTQAQKDIQAVFRKAKSAAIGAVAEGAKDSDRILAYIREAVNNPKKSTRSSRSF